MKKRKAVKSGIDIVMLIVLAALFCLDVTGILAHMLLGIVMLILAVTHNILNLSFWENIGKGRYPRRRIIQTVWNVLLLAAMLLAVVSGFLFADMLHRVSALLLLILSAGHVGIHIKAAFSRQKRRQ